jgi:NAD(P)-dependent dehydrogenase (short-subunit alcohol dehydrogenase family)
MGNHLELLSLTGKTALVTGAGTGLGLQMALGLAEAGANLVVCGRRLAPLEECAAQARAFGATVKVIPADVTVEEDVQRLKAEAGQIDILVNNAGFGMQGKWTEVSLAEWRQVMALNLDAPFRLIQLFAPPMMERGWGRIINIASIYGSISGDTRRYPGLDWDIPSYFASKHGLHGITHYLAPRLAPHGVCINSLSPGMFPSEQNDDKLTPAVLAALIDGTPMQRLGETDDLKAAVVFLASPGAKFMTGQDLIVDGGWTVW